MIKSYILLAVRNIVKDKLYAFINLSGLAIGLAASLLILLFVQSELSYDEWLSDADRIYRLHSRFEIPGRSPFVTVRSSGPMAEVMPLEFGEIEAAVRLNFVTATVLRDGEPFTQSVALVDPSLFEVLDLPVVAGNRETMLDEIGSLVLSETTARKYFGDGPALGQSLTICCVRGQSVDMKVTGILRDLPENSHLALSMLMPINKEAFANTPWMFESWTSVNNYTYFKLRDGADPAAMEARFPAFLDKHIDVGDDAPVERISDMHTLDLMNILEIHLNAGPAAGDMGGIKALGSNALVIGLSLIAALIMTIAAINYMNLATARSTARAREISMRKVLGANRRSIVFQFLGESVLTSLLAMLLALMLVEVSLPYFSAFLERTMSLTQFGTWQLVVTLAAIVVGLGVFSGLYPALYLSGFRPSNVLQCDKAGGIAAHFWLRNGLVTFQFAVSIGLIIITLIIFWQTDHAKNMELGFERHNKLVIQNAGQAGNAAEMNALKNEISRHPDVISAVYSSDVPTQNNENNAGVRVPSPDGTSSYVANLIAVDFGFFESYGISQIAGRLFDEKYGSDRLVGTDDDEQLVKASVILNQEAVRQYGFGTPQEAIGRTILTSLFEAERVEFTVAGVVPDIQFRSARYGVRPTLYLVSQPRMGRLTVTFRERDPASLAAEIETIWKGLVPSRPLRTDFLNQMVEAQYVQEDRQTTIFLTFSILAVIIAALGLYGLASYSVERRTKEITIRKVLGAEVGDIVRLLMWSLSGPVLIANLVAWPVSGYLMQQWLAGFEHRIAMNPILFLAAGLAAMVIAWITVGGHAFRVARAKPANALRYE